MKADLRVVFFSNRNCYYDGENCYFDGANGRLINELSRKYPAFTLVAYSDKTTRPYYNYPITARYIRILPFMNTFANGVKRMIVLIRLILKLNANHDILIVQLPFKSFLAPLFIRKPAIFHICSNLQTAALNPVKYKGWKKYLTYSYATLLHKFNGMVLNKKHTSLIANGKELSELYQDFGAKAVVSSSVYHTEVLEPKTLRGRGEIFTILFVGRPSLEKGFDTLLEAFQKLGSKYATIRLQCIGFDYNLFLATWKQKINTELLAKIEFLGEIPFSDKLFDFYKNADVLVLPSRSEGTPRVLVEARAFGCPVIASNVGGIPFSVSNNEDGILFPAGDSVRLEEEIKRMMHDEKFRHQLRINGILRVKDHMTLEYFVQAFEDSINDLIINE